MRAFRLSCALLGLSLVLWGGLAFYGKFLGNQIFQTNQKTGELLGQLGADPRTVANFYQKVANLKSLLESDTDTAKIFPFLENTVHQNVIYNGFDFSLPERRLAINGTAVNERALTEQLAIFKTTDSVERVELVKSENKRDKVTFNLALYFQPQFLKNF
ncbi:MAG: hypothetical protein AAB885_00055 [Patescibacteria group bacterium]